MRASSRAPSDLRVILQVRSSSWQLIVVPRLSPLLCIQSPLNAITGERKDRGERAGMDENARVAHSSLRTIASFRFIKSIAEHCAMGDATHAVFQHIISVTVCAQRGNNTHCCGILELFACINSCETKSTCADAVVIPHFYLHINIFAIVTRFKNITI